MTARDPALEAVAVAALERTPLFEGLPQAVLREAAALMYPRSFGPHARICREGDPGESLFLIVEGLALALAADPDTSEVETIARLRRGDVVGEIALLTGAPRSASVVASVPTTVLELRRDGFARLVARHPQLLENLGRILAERVVRATFRHAERRRRGEAIALLGGRAAQAVLPALVPAAREASPGPLAWLELGESPESAERALIELDDLLPGSRAVVVSTGETEQLRLLAGHVDRVVAVVGEDEGELRASLPDEAEVLLVGESGREGGADGAVRVLSGLGPREVAWVGRHLARTKLGVALGAGGAKGYAHVAVLRALERAGYTVDVVGGSSIGAVVAAWYALGMSADEVEATMRGAFTPEAVEELFRLSLSAASTGVGTLRDLMRETTAHRSFAQVGIPLVVAAVDLDEHEPTTISEGSLWEALTAAMSVPGVFPPAELEGHRLVDAVSLVPVPTEAVAAAGADVTLSVNLLSRATLPSWPGEALAQPRARVREGGRYRLLDTLLEVSELASLDASARHAALADIVVTPRFGPSTWRDFHLADRFLAAGREAAAEALPALAALASPASGP